MRVTRLVAITIAVVLLITGCNTSGTTSKSKMQIKPAELSESESNLLDMVGVDSNILLYDYTIDDTVKTITIDTLTLNDKRQWESSGGVTSSSDVTEDNLKDGRIMIAASDDGSLRLVEHHENGNTSYSIDSARDSIVGDGAKVSGRNEGITEIVFDQPIPLAFFGRSTGDTVRTYALSEYQNTALYDDFESATVVTICFSQRETS